jgi:DnaB-like helicase N terminal domain
MKTDTQNAPQNLEAEKSILGSCLQFPDIVPEVISRLRTGEHFYLPTDRRFSRQSSSWLGAIYRQTLRRLGSFFLKTKAGSLHRH